MKPAGDALARDRLKRRATQERMHRARRKFSSFAYLSAYRRAHTTIRRRFRRPHVATIFIAEQNPALPEILVVRVNAAADVTVSVRPRACLDVNALPNEAEWRTPPEGLD